AQREKQHLEDIAAVMRMLETALVLGKERGSSTRELGKLRARCDKLEAELIGHENELTDLREKKRVFGEQTTGLRLARE
ncbi:hypothetical protein A2U01_0095713, partial [Trifolium medium]|nr:hypothetical protein [Trifolium medium]